MLRSRFRSRFFRTVVVLGFCSWVIPVPQAMAAPCCARSPAAPFLIVGDDEAQVNLGLTYSSVIAEPNSAGVPTYLPEDRSEKNFIYRMDGAVLLSDLFQAGVSVPVMTHRDLRNGQTSTETRVSDIRVSGGYEFLPAWTYSKWKPQGFLFTVLNVPTGQSPFEQISSGLFSVSFGTLLIKRWTLWDVFLVPEVHYSLPREFDSGVRLVAGFGTSIGMGVGVSPGGGSLRVGGRIQPRWDQGREYTFNAGLVDRKSVQTAVDVGIDLSYLLTSTDTLMVSYTDQTRFAPAMGQNLNRIFALSFQHRWER